MTIVVEIKTKPLEQVTKQLNKLVNVLKVAELERGHGRRARARTHQGARPRTGTGRG